ncbi:ABC transporter ATP-binding protein [Phascolarctobacterium sp.]|uniref:ABC transporter ATP-binding protein n=1 Tax=Phascolarctobacterium sp. TaxID=2049039 RepID=UPI002A82B83E|nr:ABC transporter ATP-binding protein [Phascolarctobacterium sp.]
MQMKEWCLRVQGICKSYGAKQALQRTDEVFAEHSFTCIVGRSGCGKTTLLRLLCGLEKSDAGVIELPQGKRIAPVFQEPRLMPWLNVGENITLAAQHDRSLDTGRLPELLRLLELEGTEKLYPNQLSGGMAQRVSLGRTLFYNPDIILMDEPFSALDYFTRQGLQQTLLRLYAEERKTIIFVTHDVEEALLLGDRVLIMDSGRVREAVPVKLPRPRQAADSEFQLLRQKILQAL